MSSCFEITIENHIAHLVFNRPEALNSMSKEFWVELPLAIRDIESNTDARVIVISSTGKHFCAGMDLGVFTNPKTLSFNGEPGRVGEALRRLVLQLQASLSVLEEVRLPVLTAVHGGAIGGAVDLVCASDMRYCTEDAYFTIKETQIGMTADMGTLQRLPKLIPDGIARELAYTGRKFHSAEAKEVGFVNRVFPDQASMLEGVMEIAASIAKNSPLAVTGTKEMLNYSRDHSVEESLKYMAAWQSGMFRPEDLMKSFQASAMKQTADYQDLRPVKGLFEE